MCQLVSVSLFTNFAWSSDNYSPVEIFPLVIKRNRFQRVPGQSRLSEFIPFRGLVRTYTDKLRGILFVFFSREIRVTLSCSRDSSFLVEILSVYELTFQTRDLIEFVGGFVTKVSNEILLAWAKEHARRLRALNRVMCDFFISKQYEIEENRG
jgi:hypothetical protein